MAERKASGFLTGDKIALRGIRRSDLEHYRRWLDNAEVTHFLEMGWRPTHDQDLEAVFKNMTENHETVAFVVEHKSSGQPVGVCGLYLIQWLARRGQFNILIGDPAMWDQGLGSEATRLILAYGFDTLNLESIQLGVNGDNVRAVRAYEKAGFVHEGVRRKFVYRNGRYYDVVVMSVLREDYESTRKTRATASAKRPGRKRA